MDDKAEIGIFLGYAARSKGYRVYNIKTKRIIISRDIQVDEDAYWDWDKNQVQRAANPTSNDNQSKVANDGEDPEARNDPPPDSPVLKMKSLAEIYEKCSFVVNEPSCFEEASMLSKWVYAMNEKLAVITKNDT